MRVQYPKLSNDEGSVPKIEQYGPYYRPLNVFTGSKRSNFYILLNVLRCLHAEISVSFHPVFHRLGILASSHHIPVHIEYRLSGRKLQNYGISLWLHFAKSTGSLKRLK